MKKVYNILNLSIIIFIFTGCNSFKSHAANADTVSVTSTIMKKAIKNVVIYPNGNKSDHYPVLYLLHGYGGCYNSWIKRVPELKTIADNNNIIIVCPDGAISSWYVDSPIDSTMQYETYVSKELVAFIDQHYNTKNEGNKYRAISGFSMGGFGALFLALRHPDIFGACGSMSGALNLTHIKKNFDVNKRLGDTALNAKYYADWSIINMLKNNPNIKTSMILDCGREDFIFGMSKEANEKMIELNIPHDYIERPGKHDWKYWSNAIQYQVLFFRNYFNTNHSSNKS